MERVPVLRFDVLRYPTHPSTVALDLTDISNEQRYMQYRAKSVEDARVCLEKIAAALTEHTDIDRPAIVGGDLFMEGDPEDEEA